MQIAVSAPQNDQKQAEFPHPHTCVCVCIYAADYFMFYMGAMSVCLFEP